MTLLKVAAAQMRGGGDAHPSAEVVQRMVTLLDHAARSGVEILVFPELSLTNYFPAQPYPGLPTARPSYHDIPDPLSEPLFKRADEHGIDLIVPFAEWANGERHNSALIWKARKGVVGTYRKVHTPETVEFQPGRANAYERDWFSPGSSFPTFDLGSARVGVEICYDRHLPESSRSLALAGAEIIFLASNSQSYGSDWRREIWDVLCRARAYENVVFLVAANKVGEEGQMHWHGGSCIVSPRGTVLARAGTEAQDALVAAELDLDDLEHERKVRRFLTELRNDAYLRSST